jgi:hypothetical protein
MHSDNAASYIGALVIVAIIVATAAWGSAALAVWKAALQ